MHLQNVSSAWMTRAIKNLFNCAPRGDVWARKCFSFFLVESQSNKWRLCRELQIRYVVSQSSWLRVARHNSQASSRREDFLQGIIKSCETQLANLKPQGRFFADCCRELRDTIRKPQAINRHLEYQIASSEFIGRSTSCELITKSKRVL